MITYLFNYIILIQICIKNIKNAGCGCDGHDSLQRRLIKGVVLSNDKKISKNLIYEKKINHKKFNFFEVQLISIIKFYCTETQMEFYNIEKHYSESFRLYKSL